MVESIIALLTTGLKLWSDLERIKYQDRLISLRKRYYEEYSKPEAERSDAELDNIIFELKLLSDSFVARAGTSNPPLQP